MRLRLFEAAQQAMQLPLPRGWPDVSANFIVEDDQARRVALILNREIEQRRRSEARVVHLAHGMRGKLHRVARVEQHGEDTVGFAAIAFEVGALGAGKDVPVHVPQVVARRIRAVFGEFLAEAEIRRAMQTVDESIDDSLRHQIQAGNSGEHRGIEKALQHLRAISSSTAKSGCATQALDGGGMYSSNCRKISSESMRSDSAWKFSKMRWRSTGIASARMSSYATL